MPRNRTEPVSVDEVRARFEEWRQNRQGRARIPDELWSAAIELACRDGVNQTASALRLDGGKLKRLMTPDRALADKPTPPAFFELMPSGVNGSPEYTLELEGRKGKLRIHCKGTTAAELVELSRALWAVAS